MVTVDDFCWALEQYVGFVEQPLGSNNVPGITDRCGCNATWCAWCNMTLSVAYQDAGGDHNCWSVPLEAARAQAGEGGFTWIDDPYAGQRGDWPCIDWDRDGALDHIEGIVGVLGPGDYHTVGGNVADRCLDQHRTAASGVIAGFVRPPYTDNAPAPEPTPTPPAPIPPEDDDMPGPISEAHAAEEMVDGWYQRYLGVPPVGAGDPAHGVPAGSHPDPKGRVYWIENMTVRGIAPGANEQSFVSEAAKRNAALQ